MSGNFQSKREGDSHLQLPGAYRLFVTALLLSAWPARAPIRPSRSHLSSYRPTREDSGRVPKVCQLGGLAIYVNADDHFPAHFHVRAGGRGGLQAWIEINSLAVRHTNLHPTDLGMVLNWAAQRQDELRKAWEQAKAGQLPEAIPPV